MHTDALKTNRVVVHAVNQHPIRFDMKIVARLPFTFHGWSPSSRGRDNPANNNSITARRLLPRFFSQFHVAFELPGKARRTHQMFNCLNRPDTLEA